MLCELLGVPICTSDPSYVSSNMLIDDGLCNNIVEDSSYREKKRIQHSADIEELIKSLGGLSLERDYWIQTVNRVKSSNPKDKYEGTRRFRMMLSVSGDIPIQDVIDTGIVPELVKFIASNYDSSLQFEAAWALTNIASGTCSQTEVVVANGAIPNLIKLLDSDREDVREQGMWGLGNIAGDRTEYRDMILSFPTAIEKFINSCKRSRRISTIRTGIWSLSNLCRGKPRPEFHLVAPVVPYLARILSCSEDQDTLSDACWGLDGLSEQSVGIASIISNNLIPLLTRLLCHRELVVQRPALRVIGQIVVGDVEQTQEVIDNGVLRPLLALLDSSRKSIRKDACWAISNISAGSPEQLQEILNAGIIPKLVSIFHNDSELEVKKEAAWAICNACTAQKHNQLEYLISNQCIEPVCEMLTIDDTKILEVALEALDNIINFGDKIMAKCQHPVNICVEIVKKCDGVTYLLNLHTVSQEYGNYKVWEKSGFMLQKWFGRVLNGTKHYM